MTRQLDPTDATKVAIAKAFVDDLYGRLDDMRAELDRMLRAENKRTGCTKWSAALEGYGRIGAVSFPESKPSRKVTNKDAFAEWVETNRSADDIEYKVVVRPASEKAILANLTPMSDGKLGLFNEETGEMETVPGVAHYPGGDLQAMQVTFEGGTETEPGGRDIALAAFYDAFEAARAMVNEALALTTGSEDQADDDIVDAEVVAEEPAA